MAIPAAKTARVMWLTALIWAVCQFIVPWIVGSAMVAIDSASGGRLEPFFAGAFYNLFIGPALVGGIAGYFTVVLLRSLPTLRTIRARTVVLVSMAALFLGIVLLFVMVSLLTQVTQDPQPAPGGPEYGEVQLPSPGRNFAIGFSTWILPGLLIGQSIASEIRQSGLKLSSRQAAWIVVGWGLGFAIGGGLEMVTRDLIYAPFLYSGDPGGRMLEFLMLLPDAIEGFLAGLIGSWATLRGIQAERVVTDPI